MSQYPSQTRTVDPFASYNSDTVNKLTRMVTGGENYLFSTRGIDVIADSTSPTDHVVATEGGAFIEDVWLQITADHRVDFTNADHYINFGSGFDEGGYYYVVLDYDYVKSRPAPRASVKIIKPSQITSTIQSNLKAGTGQYLLLKVVQVTAVAPHQITTLYDYDPTDTEIYRRNTSVFAGVVYTLPTFDHDRDYGRIVYVRDEDAFYFGLWDSWQSVVNTGTRVNLNTTGIDVGQLVFINSSGNAEEAYAYLDTTLADGVVISTGSVPDGKIRINGLATVNIDSTAVFSAGDIAYLSAYEPGTITNEITPIIHQSIGRVLSVSGNQAELILSISPPQWEDGIVFLDTSSRNKGEIGSINGAGGVDSALADGSTWADGVVRRVGTGASKIGVFKLFGEADSVRIQAGNTVSIGDELFLSDSNAGTITNVRPSPYVQEIGRALEAGIGLEQIEIIFKPGAGRTEAVNPTSLVSESIVPADWTLSGTRYYYDVDISSINATSGVVVKLYEINIGPPNNWYEVEPNFVEWWPPGAGDLVRIWMPSLPTITHRAIVVGA